MPSLLSRPTMTYHGNSSFPGRIEKRQSTISSRSSEHSMLPSRSPIGLSLGYGQHTPWSPPENQGLYADRWDSITKEYRSLPDAEYDDPRVSSPPKDHFPLEQPARTNFNEQFRLAQPQGSYQFPDKASIAPSCYDQYTRVSPPLAPKPIGEPPRSISHYSSTDVPVSLPSDSRMRELVSFPIESNSFPERLKRRSTEGVKSAGRHQPPRRAGNRDEFDGPTQLLQMPFQSMAETQEEDLPLLPTTLNTQEQDRILCDVNGRLAQCAFDFVAKYQFPIPVEPDKRQVRAPQDREWTEWVYLLKRLATKRRIPTRVLYDGQIKQFVTILENSLETRHTTNTHPRPLKDDRNIFQFISAGTQVAKILKDGPAMEYFNWLYVQTEKLIYERRCQRGNVLI